jgi:hypothetical protein
MIFAMTVHLFSRPALWLAAALALTAAFAVELFIDDKLTDTVRYNVVP